MNFESHLQIKGYSTATITSYQNSITQFEQWLEKENLPLESLSYTDALAYIQERKVNQNQHSIQTQLIALKHYYQSQALKNPFERIKLRGIKKRPLYRTLAPHELSKYYVDYPADTTTQIRNKTILGFLFYQGLTIKELANLKIKDLELRAGTIYIAGSRKSNERTLELERYQVMDLYEYIHQVRKGKPEENLYVNKNLSDAVHKLLAKLNQKRSEKLTLRQIRASVIVKWFKQYNLREAQYRAGHRYISSTEAYLQNEVEGLKEEIQQYHPLG